MTTPNPWRKRKSGPREFMPPSRALLAEKDGRKATATWCYRGNHWKCESATGFLKYMLHSVSPDIQRVLLEDRVDSWHWIEPNTARVLKAPF